MSTPYVGLGPSAEYPAELVADTTLRGGIRFVAVGEEAENFVFLGHPYHRDVLAAIELISTEDKLGREEPAERDELNYTYARFMTKCPAHREDVEACSDCQMARSVEQPDGWWLTWSTPDGNPKANRGKPGYFPVVIWDAEA